MDNLNIYLNLKFVEIYKTRGIVIEGQDKFLVSNGCQERFDDATYFSKTFHAANR